MNRIVSACAGLAGLWFLLLAAPRSPGEALVKYLFAGILLWFAYRRFRAAPRKLAAYTRHEEGEAVRFEVLPATAPTNLPMAAFATAFGAGIVGSGVAYLWVMGLLFAGGAALLLLYDPRGQQAGLPRVLRAGPAGMVVDGRTIRPQDIDQLRIRNDLAGDVVLVYDAAHGIPTGQAIGLAHRRRLATVAYRIELESGGKAHVLAAGLDDTTARGLANALGRALGMGA